MPTGQRYRVTDLLLPFESRHYSHHSPVTRTKMVILGKLMWIWSLYLKYTLSEEWDGWVVWD